MNEGCSAILPVSVSLEQLKHWRFWHVLNCIWTILKS